MGDEEVGLWRRKCMGGETRESKMSQRGRREEGERIRRSIEETRDGLMVRDCRE